MRKLRRATRGHGPARSAAKERFWRRHITRQAAGGLAIRAYCADHGLSEPSFYGWRRELAQRDRQTTRQKARQTRRGPGRRFVALTLERRATASPVTVATAPLGGLELVHPRGHVLRLGPGCDRDLLTAVLAALEQPSC